jgi:SulP family sulfate permease
MEKTRRACWLVLPRYSPALLRRDLVAGLTVATVAVPQAMAYALLAGISPVHGLYTAIVMAAVGSFFGSSSLLINGPTNAISLAVLGVVAGIGTGPDDPTRIGVVALLAVLAGLIQIALSLLRLGGLASHVSEEVVLGFMAGAGLLEALTQIPTLLGLPLAGIRENHILYRLWLTCCSGGPLDARSLGIGLGTVVLLAMLHRLNARFKGKIPDLLLSLVLVSTLVAILDPSASGERLRLATGLPTPQLPALPQGYSGEILPIGGGALAIALLGLVEALTMSRWLAERSGQPLDLNRQALAEGLANLGGGLFGGMPGAGSLSRSVINHHAGAATRLSGIVSAVAVAASLWLLGDLARFIPQPALAGLLLWTAWRIVEPRRLWAHVRSSPSTAAIVLSTAFTAVLIRVELAVFVGVALSLLGRAACAGMRRTRELFPARRQSCGVANAAATGTGR